MGRARIGSARLGMAKKKLVDLHPLAAGPARPQSGSCPPIAYKLPTTHHVLRTAYRSSPSFRTSGPPGPRGPGSSPEQVRNLALRG